MKYIKVNLRGRFKQGFPSTMRADHPTPKGAIARIDLLKSWNGASGIACRVTNIYSKPEWWDADWFDFIPKKG